MQCNLQNVMCENIPISDKRECQVISTQRKKVKFQISFSLFRRQREKLFIQKNRHQKFIRQLKHTAALFATVEFDAVISDRVS